MQPEATPSRMPVAPVRRPMLTLVKMRMDAMLKDQPRHVGVLKQIAEATGVPYDTITKIRSGATPNPGVAHVQALFDYLFPPSY